MPLQNGNLKEWYLELNTIDKHLEQAAAKILDNCEKLTHTVPPSPQVNAILANISENCSFHDINSQRLRKILKVIQLIMQGKDPEEQNGLLTGPQRPDEALSQSDIEEILRTNL